MKEKVKEIDIVANTMVEPGLSGGNRIFIELAKEWIKTGIGVNIFTSSEGKKICQESGLGKASYYVWKIPPYYEEKINKLSRFEIFILYLFGFFRGLQNYYKFLKNKHNSRIVWTTSDYWPDSLIGFLAKLLNKRTKWIGSLFLFAPNPFVGFREKGGFTLPSLKNIIFFLTQRPILFFTKHFADLIFVTSQPDKYRFVTAGRKVDSVIVVQGGVDTTQADRYFKQKVKEKKEYDACFIGRFHPQKGVLELVDVWERVCKVKPKARLIMVGHGELQQAVERKIVERGLNKSISLRGFLGDGEEKFAIFKKSRIVLHPAVYDSGGMAAAEAMAWGLPGVSFDLEALKTYYPSGMLKARIGDQKHFIELVLKLLQDSSLYYNTSTEARNLILKEWSWAPKAEYLKKIIFNQFL